MRSLDELDFREWAGCTVSDGPGCHVIADSSPLTERLPHRWPHSVIGRLNRLLGASGAKICGALK